MFGGPIPSTLIITLNGFTVIWLQSVNGMRGQTFRTCVKSHHLLADNMTGHIGRKSSQTGSLLRVPQRSAVSFTPASSHVHSSNPDGGNRPNRRPNYYALFSLARALISSPCTLNQLVQMKWRPGFGSQF